MAKIWTPEAPIPAAVVTLATPLSGQQPILFATRYDVKGYNMVKNVSPVGLKISKTGTNIGSADNSSAEIDNELVKTECETLSWGIKHLSVTILRDWAQSTAMITVVANIPDMDSEIPPLPDVSKYRGGNFPYLTIEDEIRIYAGYVESPLQNITGDMLDEVPIDVKDGVHSPKSNKPLAPIFWGFIDKVDFDGNSKGSGFTYIISCRDRTRVFADTRIISIPSLGGLTNKGDTAKNQSNPIGAPWAIARDVARATNGYVHSIENKDQQLRWKHIITPKDEEVDPTDAAKCELYSSYEFDNNTDRKDSPIVTDTEDPTRWLRRSTHKIMDRYSRPRFHMWLQRPPLTKSGGSAHWQILDKSPMEILQWLAKQEERPTDFFCSHVNGDFILGPRLLDVSGFSDPQRVFRTYFFRTWPKKVGDKIFPQPCVNQMLLSLRTFTSSIANFNRFVVVDASSTNGTESSLLESINLSLESVPWILDGTEENPRVPSVPARNKIIYDGSLSTYSNASGGALLSALSSSKLWSKDVNGMQMTVLGDPTWYPSEAVRIYNTVLHDYSVKSDTGTLEAYRNKEINIDNNSINLGAKGAPVNPNATQNLEDNLNSVKANENLVKKANEIGTVATNKDELILPVYKVRSIAHSLTTMGSNAGWTTSVAGVID